MPDVPRGRIAPGTTRPRKATPGEAVKRVPRRAQETLERLVEAAEQAMAIAPASAHYPQDKSDAVFKRVVYKEVRELIARNHLADLRQLVDAFSTYPRIIGLETNPFLWAFYALRDAGSVKHLNRNSVLINMGWQLLHAHRHEIEPNLLTGFLSQTAASSRRKQELIRKPGPIFHELWYVSSSTEYTFTQLPSVGGKSLDNRHGNIVDFIYTTRSTSNATLVEIKTP